MKYEVWVYSCCYHWVNWGCEIVFRFLGCLYNFKYIFACSLVKGWAQTSPQSRLRQNLKQTETWNTRPKRGATRVGSVRWTNQKERRKSYLLAPQKMILQTEVTGKNQTRKSKWRRKLLKRELFKSGETQDTRCCVCSKKLKTFCHDSPTIKDLLVLLLSDCLTHSINIKKENG